MHTSIRTLTFIHGSRVAFSNEKCSSKRIWDYLFLPTPREAVCALGATHSRCPVLELSSKAAEQHENY